LLFDRQSDPDQQHNIAQARPDIVAKMRETLIDILHEEGTPPEQFQRLGLKQP